MAPMKHGDPLIEILNVYFHTNTIYYTFLKVFNLNTPNQLASALYDKE